MTFYIQRVASAVDSQEYETLEAALDAARAPAYVGGKPRDITMIDANRYQYFGHIYTVVEGRNPRLARDTPATTKPAASSRSAFNSNGEFKGGSWLSREMGKADSAF